MNSDCMRSPPPSPAVAMPSPSSSGSSSVAAVFFFFFFSFFTLALSDPRIFEAGLSCGNASASAPNIVPMFVRDMESLSQLMTTRHFATQVTRPSGAAAAAAAAVYGLSQCHRDLSQTDCLLCFAAGRTKLPRCLTSPAARIYFDGCFLRYDRYDFFTEAVDPVYDSANCTSDRGSVDGPAREGFAAAVEFAVGNATRAATGVGGGFGVAEAGGAYALAQCWESISSDGCGVCLEKAKTAVRRCVPSRDGRGLNAGCYLRYSTVKFYSDQGASEADQGSSSIGITVAVVLVAVACIMLSMFAAYACYARVSRLEGGNIHLHKISIGDKSSLNFKYETLEKATNYFHHLKKLGQGGGGSVYKGTLPNGKVVAVKRLIFNTRQWVDEFFNEVNLISGIEHKNLVKLLGCSIEGPESLLVYEYVPNRSLDDYISDKNKIRILNWKQRMSIITGTAEGIAYLHGGCKERIIHRDIKGSNVLLDENLTPKIADFGLARCFGPDETHLSTGIAGTLGYMAPEYLVRGQLTEKADVYSFGVLVLEIICGRKSSSFREETVSLLQMVWNFYKSDNLVEAVDSCLKGEFPAQEASNVLRIGLLCTQASAAARPFMAEVVQMLTREDFAIPQPTQPPFLNANASGPATSNRSSGMSSFMSSAVRKINASYTSSECSSMPSLDKQSRNHESTTLLTSSQYSVA
ncbi:cysteine-rich receptor-like protein kinase 42 [Eucalyptus grandis]|uniref:cysteine-rich receptor-like protein kinase 42 n=1 Tax=Eucalyptus grandis TaxID=71139 RepID=UPI00192EB659|nr:cysteine-rich receptor-like protein kinase 42 [Eucalyptus grandis]